MHLGFSIWAPCMGPWDPWRKQIDFGPLAWALWDPWPKKFDFGLWARAGPGPGTRDPGPGPGPIKKKLNFRGPGTPLKSTAPKFCAKPRRSRAKLSDGDPFRDQKSF